MIRALLPYLLTAIVAVILRDLECFLAAKLFCWRKRRQTQRQAQQDRELRELQAKLTAVEEMEKNARIAKLMAVPDVPFPHLVGGPLAIEASTWPEATLTIRELVTNFRSQKKIVASWSEKRN
jgi:hypothetical protein